MNVVRGAHKLGSRIRREGVLTLPGRRYSDQYPAKPGLPRKKTLLIGCGILLGAIVVAGGGALALLYHAVKSSDFYVQAVERIQENPAVVEALGVPIRASLPESGNFDFGSSRRAVGARIPLAGPKGGGVLQAAGEKKGQTWEFSSLVVTVKDTGEMIVVAGLAEAVAPVENQDAAPPRVAPETLPSADTDARSARRFPLGDFLAGPLAFLALFALVAFFKMLSARSTSRRWQAIAQATGSVYLKRSWLCGPCLLLRQGKWTFRIDIVGGKRSATLLRVPYVAPAGPWEFTIVPAESRLESLFHGAHACKVEIDAPELAREYAVYVEEEAHTGAAQRLLGNERLRELLLKCKNVWVSGHRHFPFLPLRKARRPGVEATAGSAARAKGMNPPGNVGILWLERPGSVRTAEDARNLFLLAGELLRGLCSMGLATDEAPPWGLE